jgi:hypothetical protein
LPKQPLLNKTQNGMKNQIELQKMKKQNQTMQKGELVVGKVM